MPSRNLKKDCKMEMGIWALGYTKQECFLYFGFLNNVHHDVNKVWKMCLLSCVQ